MQLYPAIGHRPLARGGGSLDHQGLASARTTAAHAAGIDAQQRVNELYKDVTTWTRLSILNSAASGRFSTDRTMRDYNDDIWHLDPISLT